MSERANIAWEFEPSLLPPSARLRRRFDISGMRRAYLAYLQQRIARHPRDLRAHVERILQAMALRDAEAADGALQALFIVLGAGGHALRASLLEHVKPLLDSERWRYLHEHLASGLAPTDAGSADPMALAHAVLAAGDEAAAGTLLEEALQQDPGRSDLSAALLAYYRRHGLAERFTRTRTALLGRDLALGDRWQELAQEFAARPAASAREGEEP